MALIGYAFMGKAHSNAWRNVASSFDVPAFERRILVGRDPDGVTEAAAKYGWAESATDWRAVIARDDIQIVDICAPGFMHAEIAIAALAAGKHVLVEKPLANTLAEAKAAAARAARDNGVQSMVGFNYRRVPALALARELIAEGRLGTVRQVRAAYLQDWLVDPDPPMTWRLNKETAGSGALGDIAFEAWDKTFEVNVNAPLMLAREVGLQMPAGGSIVNIASTDAFIGSFRSIAYSAGKAALLSVTYSLANVLGPRGIRVNAVTPGWVDSGILTESYEAATLTPLGRNGCPDDIAKAVAFLLSKEASFITGSSSVVDGGYTKVDYFMKKENDSLG